MRRDDRALSEEGALAILEKGEYGVLSTVSESGAPHGIPLNYCVINGNIYFHCAMEGYKLDNIAAHPSVSFCVVGNTQVIPEKFATEYESCIVYGTAEEVSGEEQILALEGLVAKYSADYIEKGGKYLMSMLEKVKVVRITPKYISGKARKAET